MCRSCTPESIVGCRWWIELSFSLKSIVTRSLNRQLRKSTPVVGQLSVARLLRISRTLRFVYSYTSLKINYCNYWSKFCCLFVHFSLYLNSAKTYMQAYLFTVLNKEFNVHFTWSSVSSLADLMWQLNFLASRSLHF